jgi:hypothetical protein
MITKLLPIFAVRDCATLRRLLPQLFAILARVLCWSEGTSATSTHSSLPEGIASDEEHGPLGRENFGPETGARQTLDANLDLQWERLELSLDSPAGPAPSPQRYFTFLYFLFPCSLIAFLRDPVGYLTERKVERPYAVDWEDALDHEQIKTKSEVWHSNRA